MITQETRNQIENAFSLDSNLKSKKEFFKEVVEPAKVAAVKTFDPYLKPLSLELNSEDIFSMIKRCVFEIHDGEKIYNRVDISDSELDEFIENMTGEKFTEVMEFFDTMPKVQHSVEVTNPKTKKKGEVILEGLQSFFD